MSSRGLGDGACKLKTAAAQVGLARQRGGGAGDPDSSRCSGADGPGGPGLRATFQPPGEGGAAEVKPLLLKLFSQESALPFMSWDQSWPRLGVAFAQQRSERSVIK